MNLSSERKQLGGSTCPDAVMGRCSSQEGGVPQSDDVETGSDCIGPKHQARDNHGLLCRN